LGLINAVGTQILANSGFARLGQSPDKRAYPIPNLGHYITEQTLIFCQIILHKTLVDEIRHDIKTVGKPGEPGYRAYWDPADTSNINPAWWNNKVVNQLMKHQEDPLCIPLGDPGEQDRTVVSKNILMQ
jgi:hypothetical protein